MKVTLVIYYKKTINELVNFHMKEKYNILLSNEKNNTVEV